MNQSFRFVVPGVFLHSGSTKIAKAAAPLRRWVLLGILAFATGVGLSVQAATLNVLNSSDAVNGDVSSPAALAGNPSSDGISLREAILAANATLGPHSIIFAPALAGQTIVLTNNLSISRNGVALTGLANPDGSPAITLDGVNRTHPVMLNVTASDVSVSRLRFTRIGEGFAIQIRAGLYFGTPGPQSMQNVLIEENAFSNSGYAGHSLAVSLGMESSASNASLGNVLIARNTFADFAGDSNGIHIAAGGTGNIIHDVTVRDNVFTNVTYGTELVAADASASRVERVSIVNNTFTGNLQPLNLNHIGTSGQSATSGNVIDNTWIAGNFFSANRGPDIVLLGGMSNATGNTISNTQIVNNIITRVSIVGGRSGGTLNQVNGVEIVNNTIALNVGNGVDANPDPDPEHVGGNNTISGITVLNSILYANSLDFYGVGAGQVSYSITAQGGFTGVNGNVTGNPLFVNAAQGNFRLQAGSPAIDAGSANGAPTHDQECRSRTDDPTIPNTGVGMPPYIDIGAFEFGSQPFQMNNLSTATSFGSCNIAGVVVEFYNTNLDHYFITADTNEAADIDGGSAGPGWSRTGYSFNSGGSTSVCRFYGSQLPGPNSHFFTLAGSECDGLKQLQASTPDTEKRWNFESLGFVSSPPTTGGINGTCPTGTQPVYRAYNNGFARGVDSNHRITSSLTAIQEVVTRGWSDEGVVMCAPI